MAEQRRTTRTPKSKSPQPVNDYGRIQPQAPELEEVAKMAYRAETINPRIQPAPQELQDKHYNRKHGKNAYYGQTVQK